MVARGRFELRSAGSKPDGYATYGLTVNPSFLPASILRVSVETMFLIAIGLILICVCFKP